MSSGVIGGYVDGLLADRRWKKFDMEGQSPLFFMLGGKIPTDRPGPDPVMRARLENSR